MLNNSDIHYRKSIRLKDYDYSQTGGYFVTICTKNRQCVFGEIIEGQMVLNDAGWMVQRVWDEIPGNYPGIETDVFIVMPDHIHGIIIIVGAGPCACPVEGQPRGIAPTMSLPDIVNRFKTMTTKRYTDGVKQCGWRSYPGRLWQRNYFDRVIRNEKELDQIREYIFDNPEKWEIDGDKTEIFIPKEI
jgi:REP element-mobilizing transposase RayT